MNDASRQPPGERPGASRGVIGLSIPFLFISLATTTALAADPVGGPLPDANALPSDAALPEPPTAAPTAANPPATAPAGEVVVRGNTPETERRESPYSVTVVDVKRQSGRADDLTEILNRSAGLKVRVSGGEGSDRRISIRGLEGRRVAIFLNGVPVSTDDGSFSLSNLPIQLIDRIEIYKGIVPAEFGGDGLGSAINVITRNIQQRYLDTGYTLGSFNTHRVFASSRYWDPDGRYVVDLGVIGNHSDNDYLMPGVRAGTLVRRDHDRFTQVLGSAGVELRKTWFDSLRFDLSGSGSQQQLQGLPGSTTLRNNVRDADFNRRSLVGRLSLVKNRLLPGLDLTYGLTASYLHGNFSNVGQSIYDFDGNRRPNPNGRGEFGVGPNESANKRYELRQRLNLHYAIDKHQSLNLNSFVVRTIDRPDDPVANAAAGFNISQVRGELFTSAIGLAHQGKFLDDRLTTVVGLKHFYVSASGKTGNINLNVNNAPLSVVTQGHEAAGYNAGVRYAVARSLAVKLSFEHAVRLPSSQEIFGNGFTIQGTVKLQPEEANNLDLGLYFDKKLGRSSRLQVEVSGFYSRVSNLITLIGGFTPNYANVGEARVMGLDVDIKADITRLLSVYANGTYQDPVDVTPFQPGTNQPSFVHGLRIPNVPYLFGSYGAVVQFRVPGLGAHSQTRLFYDSTAVARYFYDYQLSARQSRDIPGYWVHTLGIQQTFDDSRYSVSGEVINVGDKLYSDQFSRPLPGRSFRVLFRTTFFD